MCPPNTCIAYRTVHHREPTYPFTQRTYTDDLLQSRHRMRQIDPNGKLLAFRVQIHCGENHRNWTEFPWKQKTSGFSVISVLQSLSSNHVYEQPAVYHARGVQIGGNGRRSSVLHWGACEIGSFYRIFSTIGAHPLFRGKGRCEAYQVRSGCQQGRRVARDCRRELWLSSDSWSRLL